MVGEPQGQFAAMAIIETRCVAFTSNITRVSLGRGGSWVNYLVTPLLASWGKIKSPHPRKVLGFLTSAFRVRKSKLFPGRWFRGGLRGRASDLNPSALPTPCLLLRFVPLLLCLLQALPRHFQLLERLEKVALQSSKWGLLIWPMDQLYTGQLSKGYVERLGSTSIAQPCSSYC